MKKAEKKQETKKVCYLAGPMRGYPLYNFPAFDAARDHLAANGFTVISPADLDRAKGFHPAHDDFTKDCLKEAVKRDVGALLKVDLVYVLPGFEDSTGVAAELALAKWLGLPIYRYNNDKYPSSVHVEVTYE